MIMFEIKVTAGDAPKVMAEMPATSMDAIITDPPYGLQFMRKGWDAADGFAAFCVRWAAEAYRVLKPGGHLLAFGGARTSHRLACGVEDAGFEIRDTITWMYGAGFPKSPNALKPASEPIIVARKPLVGTVAQNLLAHGTGVLNIDECRTAGVVPRTTQGRSANIYGNGKGFAPAGLRESRPHAAGRWPSNVVLSHAATPDGDDACTSPDGCERNCPVGELGEVAAFFPVFRYQAKAPGRERPKVNGVTHPTVKPLELMRWLVRLACPPGGVVLDPFAGSGTTGEACALEGRQAVLIEREAEYLPLIAARLQRAGAA